MNDHTMDPRPMNDRASGDVCVRIVRAITAPASRAFDAWLDPDKLARWMFGPGVRDERIVHLRLDAREGGAFSFRVERGGMRIEHAGVYRVIDRPRRLAFTWGAWAVGEAQDASSLVEIMIEPRDGGCELCLTHTMSAQWADYAARTEQGWRHMLETLDATLSTGDHGALIADDTMHFERLFPGSVERLWSYLTDSEKRARWLASGPIASNVGTKLELRFRNAELSRDDDRAPEKYRDYENSGAIHGRVTRCEPPRLLAFTWCDREDGDDASEVCFELERREEGVLLTLTHRRLGREQMPSVGAGWHTHLGILDDLLRDREPRPFWRTHTALETEYGDLLASR